MKLYPLTVSDFENMFPTDETCYQYLAALRWSDGFRCHHCGHHDAWKLKKGIYRCRKCLRDVTLTAGTIFHRTRTPLRLWFQAVWYIVNQKQGVSALGLQRILGLKNYETTWTWLHKLRSAMVRPGRDRLSGIVEVDETLVGGYAQGKPGRSHGGKILVLVGVEDRGKKGFGRVRLRVIADASGPTLRRAVEEMVEAGSTVRTDGWSGYNSVADWGFRHEVVARTEEEPGKDPTPLVQRIASLLKRWLMGTHHGRVEATHLGYYLDEFTFRFNRRKSKSRGHLFYRLMEQALMVPPMPLKQLRKA